MAFNEQGNAFDHFDVLAAETVRPDSAPDRWLGEIARVLAPVCAGGGEEPT